MSITSRNGKVANAIGPRKRADGVRLTREVVWALLPMSREDEAVAAIIDGALVSAELLEEDEHGLPSRRASNTRQAIKVLEPPTTHASGCPGLLSPTEFLRKCCTFGTGGVA